MSIKRLVIPLCAALALGVAACGSDDEGGGDSTSTVKQDEGSPAQTQAGHHRLQRSRRGPRVDGRDHRERPQAGR